MSQLRFSPSSINSHHSSIFPDHSSSMAEMARLHSSIHSPQRSANHAANYTEELWRACAGPLVSVPKVGERVWYFPQGHMEQVTASTGSSQGSDHQMPQYNLPSQILCRVMNLSLSAEPETDEVFAQLALLPEPEEFSQGMDQIVNCAEGDPSVSLPQQRPIRMFTKILTASDTSTHGGFSVLRKHAEDCLPLLDMSQETPSQELVATDLHGQEWKFRHTYRGHPRRHLLTTGWSYFVSQKKLVAGDAVVFIRGDNGELRVGIRRTKCQQPSQTSNVLTSHSMQMGVVATASHAILTRTMFSVYYKPRASPSSFIVPVEKLAKASINELSVGMRFKVKFEGEDASERSYAGTIVGIEDLNAMCWPKSLWRSLRVNWDEMTNHEQRNRISPWEIELSINPQAPANNSCSPAPKNKRPRPSIPSDSGSSSKSTSFSSLQSSASKHQDDEIMKAYHQMWGKRSDNHQQGNFRTGVEETMKMASPPGWLISGTFDPRKHQHILQTDKFSFFPPSCDNNLNGDRVAISMPSTLNPMQNNLKNTSTNINQGSWQQIPSSSSIQNEISPSVWPLMSMLPPTSSSPFIAMPSTRVENSKVLMQTPHAWDSQQKMEKPDTENVCKLFGFSLTEPRTLTKSKMLEDDNRQSMNAHFASQAPPSSQHIQENEIPHQSLLPDKSTSSEVEYSDNTCLKLSKESEGRSTHNPPVRSCTKVIKKGSMVGRGVDLSKFDSYKKLIEELELMFHIEGELSNPEKGWQLAYSDDEGDMMHVGDDPWTEFCSMVRKIHIFSPEEVTTAGLSQLKPQCTKDDEQYTKEFQENRNPSVPALPG